MSTEPALTRPKLPFVRLSEDEGRLRAVIILPFADEGVNVGGIFVSMSAMSVAAVTNDFASGEVSAFVDEREHHTPVFVAAYLVEIHHCLDAITAEQLFKVGGERGVLEVRSATLARLHVEGGDWGLRCSGSRDRGRGILKGKTLGRIVEEELRGLIMIPALACMVAPAHMVGERHNALFIDVSCKALRSPALGARVAGGTACVLFEVKAILTHGSRGLSFQISRLSRFSKMELWKTAFGSGITD